MKEKILGILKNSTDYVSGQELCESLGVSRTAVWKSIKALKEKGYMIDAVNNRGYKLVASPDIIDIAAITEQLDTKYFGRSIHYYEETDSTNTRAKLAGEEGEPHGTLFLADLQNAGKGRRGRGWSAEKGSSIAMTFLMRPDIDIENASKLTIISAVAIVKVLSGIQGISPQIKWPNDVVVGGRKICGILTEMSSEGRDINYVVTGMGINVYETEFPEELASRATSIKMILDAECAGEDLKPDKPLKNDRMAAFDRNFIIAAVANEFEKLYMRFVETQSLAFLVEDYNRYLVNRNKQVYVIENGAKKEYTALGLDVNGGLKVRNLRGKESVIISGEVSVRGIYGYT